MTGQVFGTPKTIQTNIESFATTVTLPLEGLSAEQLTDEAFLQTLCVYVEHDDGTTELVLRHIGIYGRHALRYTVRHQQVQPFPDRQRREDGNGQQPVDLDCLHCCRSAVGVDYSSAGDHTEAEETDAGAVLKCVIIHKI